MNDTQNTIVLSADDETAKALVATIRAAVKGAGKYVAYVAAHGVTRATVKDHARALAVLTYPNDEPTQTSGGKRTRFGNAVQAAGAGLRSALDPAESDATETDYVKLAVKAVLNAVKHDVPAATVIEAITAELKS